MLAKQVWRLLINHTSLLACSLKAKYYLRSDILLASSAHYPSFAWKSLLVGKDLIMDGITWKLGDSSRIRVGVDKWIPNGDGSFSTAKVSTGTKNLRVTDFIQEEDFSWDVGMIDFVFEQPRDRWKLFSQLKGNPNEVDKHFLPMGSRNIYTVKSGYWLASNIQRRQEASTSTPNNHMWNWIWGLEAILKVKMCGVGAETIEHALRDCPWTEFLWDISPLRLQPISAGSHCSISDWFDSIKSFPNKELHAIFATVLWSIWYARNLLVFQNKELSHLDCLSIASRAQLISPPCSATNLRLDMKVDCSRDNQVKFLCDVAVHTNRGVGLGVVLKDSEGVILGCKFGLLQGAFTAIDGEAFAVLEAIRWCRDRGFHDEIFEMDCQFLYWMLVKYENDLSYLRDTLRQIFEISAAIPHFVFI
ncbi:uncharacterized protein LOC131008471 [Salvia miltiorrhiza]|uniref:uncharacterized protein LOC131008471 n=1 Tax=Salvia miltiorrhiza TaxID=226208 RepID=UPI0025AD8B37|nr:uncharacterized protein LOC131008471 [Salvia miltiorrhiza]